MNIMLYMVIYFVILLNVREIDKKMLQNLYLFDNIDDIQYYILNRVNHGLQFI